MAAIFYLVLVFFSKVTFSPLWMVVAIVFSGREARTVYKYTTDPKLEGKETR